jgi:hypothetical protein
MVDLPLQDGEEFFIKVIYYISLHPLLNKDPVSPSRMEKMSSLKYGDSSGGMEKMSSLKYGDSSGGDITDIQEMFL